jgi:hypothetical protein
MRRDLPWFWIGLAGLLLLLPGPVGRVLLDLIGGLTLTILLLPLLLGAGGWVAWQVLRRRLKTCPQCGFVSLGAAQCPACGYGLANVSAQGGEVDQAPPELDVSQVTINVEAIDVEVSPKNTDH